MPLAVNCRLEEKSRVRLRLGPHEWLADQPPAQGGGDAGPNPFAHLLGALGSCALITLSAYAAKAKIPVAGLAGDFAGRWEGEGEAARFAVDAVLRVRGEIVPRDRERLERAAGRCPVWRVLAPGAKIACRWEFDPG